MIFRLAFSLLLLIPNVVSDPATEAPTAKPTKSSKSSKSELLVGKPRTRTLILQDMYLDGDDRTISYGNGVLDKHTDPVTTKPTAHGSLWIHSGAVEERDETETGEYWVACHVLKGNINKHKHIVASKMMCDIEICNGATLEDCVYLKGTTKASINKGGALISMDSFHATVTGGLGAYEGSIGSAANLEFEVPTGVNNPDNPPTTVTLTTTPYYS